MLVKNFAKEIQYQLAHETLKNPLNFLKTCQKPKRENHKTKDFIKGCTCSEKMQKILITLTSTESLHLLLVRKDAHQGLTHSPF